ncbi:hypothetical protein [Streptomyces sp. NPDC016845]|uniref:hypothetical protein n=1 Tax=Streptomyces sp. NPDC016845 TaxID=3364972 RepID=UPI0037983C88
MSLPSTAAQLATLAAEGGEHGGNHESISPLVTGGAAFIILILLLWITTRFNRDR